MAFLGETIGDNLHLLVQAHIAIGDRDLMSSFTLQTLAILSEAKIVTYFSSAAAGQLMNPIMMMPASTIQLAHLCPLPYA
jgi:hypothetical protein